MKQLIILAGAAAFAFAGPAIAKPGHAKGHGKSHAHNVGTPYGYGVAACPPGLAKKGCMPPGQAKKRFHAGQRLQHGYANPYAYNQIPYDLRSQYGLNPYGNYYYGDGYLYQVDPQTMLIQNVISALLR
jgi:hypothetical protein